MSNETAPGTAPGTATVTAAELAAETLSANPPTVSAPGNRAVSETAPENRPPVSAPGNRPGAERDSIGRLFDPEKFRPEKDALGRWKNLRGGRNTGKTAPGNRPPVSAPETAPGNRPAESASYVAPDAPPAPTPAGPDKYDLAADLYCRAFYGTADAVFAGKGEWAPDNEAEHEELRKALAAYLRAKGIEDLPPGPALALAVGTYCAKRMQRPNTRTRWQLFWDHFRARFAAWRTGRRIDALPQPSTPAP